MSPRERRILLTRWCPYVLKIVLRALLQPQVLRSRLYEVFLFYHHFFVCAALFVLDYEPPVLSHCSVILQNALGECVETIAPTSSRSSKHHDLLCSRYFNEGLRVREALFFWNYMSQIPIQFRSCETEAKEREPITARHSSSVQGLKPIINRPCYFQAFPTATSRRSVPDDQPLTFWTHDISGFTNSKVRAL